MTKRLLLPLAVAAAIAVLITVLLAAGHGPGRHG
jgi:hypothetical protein